MFNQRTMLRYVLLCLLFFLPIQATSAMLKQSLMASNERTGNDDVAIPIEIQAYHRTLLLVGGYTRQHAPCYIVHGLKKIITDYAYEPPVPIAEVTNRERNKCFTCFFVSFCTSLVVGVTVVGCTLYPGVSLNSHAGYR